MSWFDALLTGCNPQAACKCNVDTACAFREAAVDGDAVTSCVCGKTKIFWSHTQPAHRLKCFCNDCQQRVAWLENRGGRRFAGGPVDVTFVWNDIFEFQNEEETKWYRLRETDWCKHGTMDFCVAECCSSLLCGAHPWYQEQVLWTLTEATSMKRGASVWAHFFTADAEPDFSMVPEQNPEPFTFTGAQEEVEAAVAELQAKGKNRPPQRGLRIEEWKWGPAAVLNLALTEGDFRCGAIGMEAAYPPEKPQPEKRWSDPNFDSAASMSMEEIVPGPSSLDPLSMCCTRRGGRALFVDAHEDEPKEEPSPPPVSKPSVPVHVHEERKAPVHSKFGSVEPKEVAKKNDPHKRVRIDPNS